MPRLPEESRAITAGKWLLALVVPASAQALGSIPVAALLVMSAIAAAATALLWFESDVARSSATRWVLIAFGILLGWTILQAVPLPSSLTHALTPANADIWDRALSPLREPAPAWHSLSVAPTATRVEVLRGFFYGCIFLSALRVVALERGQQFLVRVVVFAACLMALSSLAHTAVGAEKIFGVYRPRELTAYRAGHFAPLLNTNHLAAYLDVGACVALGALITGRAMPRALSGSAVLVLAGTSVWQGSRGATAALLFGAVLTIALFLYSKRRLDSGRLGPMILAAAGIAAVFMIGIALSDVARVHLLSGDLIKVDVAKDAVHLVAASPWFGVGRGAFESVFSSVREQTFYWTFTHPEDIVVQWFVEWGVPISLGCMAILAWALRPQVVLRAARPAFGVWAAIVVAVGHDLVDYHLEVPGVVALVAVCAAIVLGSRGNQPGATKAVPPRLPLRTMALGVVLGTALAAAAAWSAIGHSLAEERRTLSAMAVDGEVSAEEFRDGVRASMLRYPAEPFLPLMGAVRVQSRGEGSVVPWIARALERSPHFGRAHFVLARSLAHGHQAQARLEYRLAYANDEQLRGEIVKEAAGLVVDADSGLELVAEGPAGLDMLDALVVAIGERLPSTAVLLDEELERRSPGAIGPLRRRAEAAATDATAGAAWCAGKECILDAFAPAEALVAREPAACEPRLIVARLRAANGEVVRALDDLEHALDGVSERATCQRAFISLALQNVQPARADAALDKLSRAGCGSASECSDLYGWAASMEESRGHYARAVQLYQRVLDVSPDREDLLEHIGGLGTHSGVVVEAIDAYGVLERRHPEDPRWPARIAELRAKARPGLGARSPQPP
jgi:tetratricopeptide (TPR) repeat protein